MANEPRVHVDDKAFRKGLSDLQRTQFPFAFAKTLTDCAKAGQTVVRAQTKKVFRLHSEYIPNQIRITPAKKGLAPEAEVRTTKDIEFMTIQETGGTKKPKGAALAIPSFPAQRSIPDLRTNSGAIRKKYLPRSLIEKERNKRRPMKLIHDGFLWLFRKALGAILPMFKFASSVKIRPRWKFAPTVRREVEKVAPKLFAENMNKAVASIKP